MNKSITAILFLVTLVTCTSKKDPLVGTWKVEGPYYHATYQIIAQDNGFVGKVMNYDDGTSHYTSEDNRTCFEGLVKQDSIYVDGVSGASYLNKKGRTICLKIKNQDSLEATTYVLRQPLKEWWVRQK